MDDAVKIIQRAKAVKSQQGDWLSYWDDLARVCIPRLIGFTEKRQPGEDDDLFDGTPMHAARGLANSIGGLLRPDGEEWVRMRATDDNINDLYDVREWFEVNGERLRSAMENPRSRMRQATGEVDLMLVVFGTGPLWVGENRDRNGLLFQAIPLKDAGIEWGDEGASGMYRYRRMTAQQAVEKFGINNLGEQAKRAMSEGDSGKDRKFTYINAVTKRGGSGKLGRNMPFSNIWVEEESRHIVVNGGFLEFPYVVPRMETAPGEDYGRSPAMIALPDAKTLQVMGKTILTAGQKAADPPLFAPDDGVFSAANTFAGGITYYDAEIASNMRGNPIFPLVTGHNLPISRDMQRDTRDQVYNAFFKNILNLPVEGPQRTATEVLELKEQMKREIGPLFGRLESDYTAPMVERVFAIMLRAGAFTEIPEALQGQEIIFEYESPVSRVRQMIEVESAKALKNEILELSQFDPGVMDNFDTDEYLRTISASLRSPTKLLRDPDIVEQIRAAKDQKAAVAEAGQMAAGVADVMKTGAEAAKTAGMV